MVPDSLRYVPAVKSDIIIQRRDVSMAPIEGMSIYQRDGTNTITFNVQGHKTTNQLLDTKSLYFTLHCKFRDGYPVEDVSNLFEEIIISSNGRVLERIRHAQYINWFLKQYGMSRESKARLGKREGYSRFEDETIRLMHQTDENVPVVPNPNGEQVHVSGDHGFKKSAGVGIAGDGYMDDDINSLFYSRMSDNLGYGYTQVNRDYRANHGEQQTGWPKGTNATDGTASDGFGWKMMKFRLKCSGLLSCEKMLPIGWMPITVQLRLSDKMRCTDKGSNNFDYAIKRPRMHFNVCTCGQAYASAMQARLRGPGITINAKLTDTYFQIINSDKQIVIPSNKQRLSKVYVMFHDEASANSASQNAFRSSCTGAYCTKPGLQLQNGQKTAQHCLVQYQFQVGTEVSEPVGLEDQSKDLEVYDRSAANVAAAAANPNSGIAFLEAYLKSIGAVNGHEQDVEYWGRQIDPLKCKDMAGGDVLQTFLHKYFCACFDGEKFLGTAIESSVDTEAGKDIIVDLKWKGGKPYGQTRVMALIQYHAQFVIKETSIEMSY